MNQYVVFLALVMETKDQTDPFTVDQLFDRYPRSD